MHWETEGILYTFSSIFAFLNRNSGNVFCSTVQGPAPLTQDEPLAEMHLHALCRYSLSVISDFTKNYSYYFICFSPSICELPDTCAWTKGLDTEGYFPRQICHGKSSLIEQLGVWLNAVNGAFIIYFQVFVVAYKLNLISNVNLCLCSPLTSCKAPNLNELPRSLRRTLFPCFVAITHGGI